MTEIRPYEAGNACTTILDDFLYQENPTVMQSIAPLQARQNSGPLGVTDDIMDTLADWGEGKGALGSVGDVIGGTLDWLGFPAEVEKAASEAAKKGVPAQSLGTQVVKGLGGAANTMFGALDLLDAVAEDRKMGDPVGSRTFGSTLESLAKTASTAGIVGYAASAAVGLAASGLVPTMLIGGAAVGAAWLAGKGIEVVGEWAGDKYRGWMGIK